MIAYSAWGFEVQLVPAWLQCDGWTLPITALSTIAYR